MRIVIAVMLALFAAPVIADDTLPKAVAEAGFKTADCTMNFDEAYAAVEMFDLPGGQKLFVLPCWRAAYQSGGAMFAMDKAGQARLLSFKSWDGKKYVTVQTLTEVDFVNETNTLTSFHKGRGIGDCGSIGEWSWAGSEFKLKGYWYKEKCDGNPFEGSRRWKIFPR